MVVLTTQYLGSHKCMLGLLTAWRLRKPIVVLREADVTVRRPLGRQLCRGGCALPRAVRRRRLTYPIPRTPYRIALTPHAPCTMP